MLGYLTEWRVREKENERKGEKQNREYSERGSQGREERASEELKGWSG